MKVILKLGYRSYLLPTDRGLQSLLKLLGDAREIRNDQSHTCYRPHRYIELEPAADADVIEFSATLIPESVKVRTYQPPPPLGLPEHGTRELLGLPEQGTRES